MSVSTRLPGDPAYVAREQRLQAMKSLVSRLAHDFNNFLTPILGYVTMIREAAGEGSATAQYVEAVERSARKSETLLDTIMTAVRPERRFAPSEVDLDLLIARLLGEWRSKLPATIRVNVDCEIEPVRGRFEANHWTTAFNALLSNARLAMPNGGRLTVRLARAHLDASEASALGVGAGEIFELVVRDDGCGMTPEIAAQALEPLFSGRGKGIALGLGLTHAHGTARMHGGQLVIESEPDRGTAIRIYFSALPQPGAAEDSPLVAAAERLGVPAGRNRILIAGCDEVLQESLRAVLNTTGRIIQLAPDSAQAARTFSRHAAAFALVVIEQQLPGMTGVDFAAQVRASQPELPIILLTLDGEVSAEKIAKAGLASRFVEMKKPFRTKGFLETAARLLA